MHDGIKFWLWALFALFAFWLLTGGYNSNLAKGRPFLHPFNFNSSYGSASDLNLIPHGDFSMTNNEVNDQSKNTNDIESIQRGIDKVSAEVKVAQAEKNASVYKGNFTLRLGGTYNNNVSQEYLRLDVSSNLKEKVLISGWKLQSTITGRGTTIGVGMFLPLTDQGNLADSIFVSGGDTVYINTARSPIGLSFKTNLCTGFFGQFQQYTPSLPIECPRPSSERLPYIPNNYIDACDDYLSNLNSCRIQVGQPSVQTVGYECLAYTRDKINYPTCVLSHKNDTGFYKPQWRVFLNQTDRLWKDRRESIQLLDLTGKVVDTLTY